MTEANPVHTLVQQPGTLQREVHVELSPDHIESMAAQRLTRLRKTVRINGFRPGHVPLGEVARRHGAQVRGEVLGDLLQNAVNQAVREHALRPANTPEIEPAPDADGKLRFVARFEVFPDVTLADFAAVQVSVPQAEVTDADVDQAIDRLRQQRADWNPVPRAAQSGDRVVVSFTGTLDGDAFEGGSATDTRLTVGAGALLPDFEAQLPGLAADAQRTFDVAFPEGYPRAELSGRTAQFSLTCSAVEEPQLPDLDDAFAQALGIAEGGVQELRAQVRKSLEAEVERQVRLRRKNAIMEALVEHHSFDLPASLVHAEAHQLAHRNGAAAHGDHDHDNADHEAQVAQFEPQAAQRVKLGLILAEVARQADLRADPAAVRREVETIARRFDDPDQVVRWYYAEPQRLQDIQNGVLEEQLVEWVAGRIQVDPEPTTFADLTGTRA